MTAAGFTISMSLTVSPTPQGTRARAPIFTNYWERGRAPDPIPGLCPSTKLRDFRLSDNLTPHHHQGAVPQTVGPEPQGTGAYPHFDK